MHYFYPLRTIPPEIHEQVGGKAIPLMELSAHGLPVPDGFVLPASVFREHLKTPKVHRALSEFTSSPSAQTAKQLRRAIQEQPLTQALKEELEACVRELGGDVALRSSAVGEDGETSSFAGQHYTALHVAEHRASDALRTCWASLFSDAAVTYRNGSHPPEAAMAVIVQLQITPFVSGVLFTTNPMNGSWREMVVESTWGLGEGLVSGQVNPHWYLVRRPRKAPSPVQRLSARIRLDVLQEDLPNIPRYLTAQDQTVEWTQTPLRLQGRRTLERRDLFRLCRLGLRVESLRGIPQDIEWCVDHDGRIHLLQARPITSTASLPVRRDVLWTRRFIGERWPEPATPMGWSILAPILDWFIGYPRTQLRYLGGGPSLRLVDYHPYINATVFRHLLFKTPGIPPLRFLLDMIPPEEERAWRSRFSARPSFSVYGSLLRETILEKRWSRFAWNPLTNHREWDQFKANLDTHLEMLTRPAQNEQDALGMLAQHQKWIRDYIRIHVTSLLYANLFYQALESQLTEIAPGESKFLLEALAHSASESQTVRTNRHMWRLAQSLSESEREILKRSEVPNHESPFTKQLTSFLERHGHRASASWEIFSPRWRDQPEILAPLLLAQTNESPRERMEQQRVSEHKARETLKKYLGRGPTLWGLQTIIRLTQTQLLLRENQRYAFDQILYATQQNLLRLGGFLVQEGAIESASDIAYLTVEEARGLASKKLSHADTQGWITRRKKERARASKEVPPVFLEGNEGVSLTLASGRLEGLGISSGRTRGVIRLIHRLEEASRLQDGEILVTRTVDPGWTPLFARASGLILELGSLLSHGAVVAREYGIPAVVNIDNVTSRLRDGQEVTIDGNRGLVWIHS